MSIANQIIPAGGALKAMRSIGRTKLQDRFLEHWTAVGGPPLRAEYAFHPTRKWRLDFAMPGQRIGIEIDGGTWCRGRHSRGAGQRADAEKGNALAAAGWVIFRFTTDMLRDGKAVRDVAGWCWHERAGEEAAR